ncbi:C4-dicarboxylate transporter [Cryobacterium algoricola]|uniref:C4-dicarboxylate transporter n=1 Tax=Cryobacterium algoricola TaxID=1259183 RepID=A0ABY2IA93_9MICO|nr:C4-dicarboxylate transporter [Cryobacterium algoricola]TFB83192.1 C4-dicarboxylate transporter [Cryobacterium algoricola]
MPASPRAFRRVLRTGRAPLTSFGIPFGLSGLAGTWTMAAGVLGTPAGIGEALWLFALVAWVLVFANYLMRSRNAGGTIRGDLVDPVQAPFAALAPTTGMLLGTHVAVSLSAGSGAGHPFAGALPGSPAGLLVWLVQGVVVAFMVAALVFGAWSVAQLALRMRDIDTLHAGYFLPTVAAAFIAGQSAGTFGWTTLSVACIGVGLLFWMLLGALILGRMAFRPALPARLLPTFAIFSAPPAVAGNAWFASNGGRLDTLETVLLGTFVLLILVQVMMLAAYWRLGFDLGFWAFTFTAAASGTYALHWIGGAAAPGAGTGAFVSLWASGAWVSAVAGTGILATVTLVVGSIAVRSVGYLVRAHGRSTDAPRARV